MAADLVLPAPNTPLIGRSVRPSNSAKTNEPIVDRMWGLVPRPPLQKPPSRGLEGSGGEGGGGRRSEGRRGLHLRKASRGLEGGFKGA